MNQRDQHAADALALASDAHAAKTTAERAAYNQRLQDHLTELVNMDGTTDGIEAHCERFELHYLPAPTWSKFTVEVAEDCDRYARQYRITLGESIREWEGDGPDGGFGLTIEQAATVAAFFKDQGRDLSEVPAVDPQS